jgi:hypothetical protein
LSPLALRMRPKSTGGQQSDFSLTALCCLIYALCSLFSSLLLILCSLLFKLCYLLSGCLCLLCRPPSRVNPQSNCSQRERRRIVYLFIYLSIFLSIWVNLSNYLSICLSVYLSICPSIRQSHCL